MNRQWTWDDLLREIAKFVKTNHTLKSLVLSRKLSWIVVIVVVVANVKCCTDWMEFRHRKRFQGKRIQLTCRCVEEQHNYDYFDSWRLIFVGVSVFVIIQWMPQTVNRIEECACLRELLETNKSLSRLSLDGSWFKK